MCRKRVAKRRYVHTYAVITYITFSLGRSTTAFSRVAQNLVMHGIQYEQQEHLQQIEGFNGDDLNRIIIQNDRVKKSEEAEVVMNCLLPLSKLLTTPLNCL